MLKALTDLNFKGIRVISEIDGLDSNDQESTLSIQIREVLYELQLQDLKQKTMGGLIGQKSKERPVGYKKKIEPHESTIVLRGFELYRDGNSINQIVKILNQEGVPTRKKFSKYQSLATISQVLDNVNYIGKQIWNKTDSYRDRTGRRKKFD